MHSLSSGRSSADWMANGAYVKILEQPAPKSIKFRYECEGKSAGSISGIKSTPELKTFPMIQIVGFKGRAAVLVSCVMKEPPYQPHPHNLVGNNCKNGVCMMEVSGEAKTASFPNLGIQCVKKESIEESLTIREESRVDPFRTGFSHKTRANSIDLNSVRLCFHAFLEGPQFGKFTIPLNPVVSDPIYDSSEVIRRHIVSDSEHSGRPRSCGMANGAYIKILEQPAQKSLRFRYECEGRSAGSLLGVKSTPDLKTFPTIQIVGYKGRAVVVVSCVTKDPPYRPHPHNLVGKENCKNGVCSLEVSSEDMSVTLTNLGIQCVKKKDIEESLKVRERIRLDPFRTGFSHKTHASSIHLNSVRLCFQAFLEGPQASKFTIPLKPVVSNPIYDKKAMVDLVICKLSHCSASAAGGQVVILLCEKVVKEDISVRFFEECDGKIVWEGYGDFSPHQVHKQSAIAFRTPQYKILEIDRPVKVFIQLQRPSDGETSEALPFQLKPLDPSPQGRKRRRQRDSRGKEDSREITDLDTMVTSPRYYQMGLSPKPFEDIERHNYSPLHLKISSPLENQPRIEEGTSPNDQQIGMALKPFFSHLNLPLSHEYHQQLGGGVVRSGPVVGCSPNQVGEGTKLLSKHQKILLPLKYQQQLGGETGVGEVEGTSLNHHQIGLGPKSFSPHSQISPLLDYQLQLRDGTVSTRAVDGTSPDYHQMRVRPKAFSPHLKTPSPLEYPRELGDGGVGVGKVGGTGQYMYPTATHVNSSSTTVSHVSTYITSPTSTGGQIFTYKQPLPPPPPAQHLRPEPTNILDMDIQEMNFLGGQTNSRELADFQMLEEGLSNSLSSLSLSGKDIQPTLQLANTNSFTRLANTTFNELC